MIDTQAVADALLAQRPLRGETLAAGKPLAARRRGFNPDRAQSRREPLRRRP